MPDDVFDLLNALDFERDARERDEEEAELAELAYYYTDTTYYWEDCRD
jgi:hypothetical protein